MSDLFPWRVPSKPDTKLLGVRAPKRMSDLIARGAVDPDALSAVARGSASPIPGSPLGGLVPRPDQDTRFVRPPEIRNEPSFVLSEGEKKASKNIVDDALRMVPDSDPQRYSKVMRFLEEKYGAQAGKSPLATELMVKLLGRSDAAHITLDGMRKVAPRLTYAWTNRTRWQLDQTLKGADKEEAIAAAKLGMRALEEGKPMAAQSLARLGWLHTQDQDGAAIEGSITTERALARVAIKGERLSSMGELPHMAEALDDEAEETWRSREPAGDVDGMEDDLNRSVRQRQSLEPMLGRKAGMVDQERKDLLGSLRGGVDTEVKAARARYAQEMPLFNLGRTPGAQEVLSVDRAAGGNVKLLGLLGKGESGVEALGELGKAGKLSGRVQEILKVLRLLPK